MITDAADRAVPDLDIDAFSEAFLTDPYRDHGRMRDAGPVVRLTRYGIYAMARYKEVFAALNDWRAFSSARGVGLQDFAREAPWRPKSIVLETDPPLHDRTRRVLQRVMSPAAMRRLREEFQAKAVRLVENLVAKRDIEAVGELAEAYPLEYSPTRWGSFGKAARTSSPTRAWCSTRSARARPSSTLRQRQRSRCWHGSTRNAPVEPAPGRDLPPTSGPRTTPERSRRRKLQFSCARF